MPVAFLPPEFLALVMMTSFDPRGGPGGAGAPIQADKKVRVV
jgi:hypothetical protein